MWWPSEARKLGFRQVLRLSLKRSVATVATGGCMTDGSGGRVRQSSRERAGAWTAGSAVAARPMFRHHLGTRVTFLAGSGC